MRAFRLTSFLLWFTFAAFLGFQALHLRGLVRDYPAALIVAVMAGMTVMVALEFGAPARATEFPSDVARLFALPRDARLRLLAFVVLWLAFPGFLSVCGLLVATSLALAVSLFLLGVRRIVSTLAGSVVFAVALAVLFSTVFYIPTPAGVLDTALTKLIYVISR
jgi:hypothetical protein